MKIRGQVFLPGFSGLAKKEFGGSLIKGNPRDSRPISVKRPMHLVLRSTLARGERSFLVPRRARALEALVHRLGREKAVKVYRYANSGNHLHLIVMPSSERAFRGFIRAICGLIARITLGVERGRALGLKFWDARPYTKILEWGREFSHACAYVLQNKLEALGFVPYRPRLRRLRKLAKGAPS